MPIDEERRGLIRANAELVTRELTTLRGETVGLDADSVAYVEGFLERQRAQSATAARDLVGVLGCYLGEAIIAAAPGADWAEDGDGTLIVQFANGDSAYPFAKVEKQAVEGLEAGESIRSFFDVCVNYIATGKLGAAGPEAAP